MPHYFFHLHDDVFVEDEEGKSLADLAAARANAVCEAREMMLDSVSVGRINFSHRIDIADESGAVLDTVTFGDAVTIEG